MRIHFPDLAGPTDLAAPSFVAIDVETEGGFGSPRLIELAAVRVVAGQIVSEGYLNRRAVIGGLRELLEEMAQGIGVLAAHNAAFERRVLGTRLGPRARPLPWLCTLALSRGRAPQLADHKLPTVAAYYGAEPFEHHDPLADARACAAIALGAWRGGADLGRRAYLLPAVGRAW